ncbi:MAG: precorrin-2 C(20)-methyltransferase [Thermodesulfobacteriota bacterium]
MGRESEKAAPRFYGVGVGPGDPELITLKAVRVLERVDVLAVPRSPGSSGSTALDIVRGAVDIEGKALLDILMPMTRDGAELRRARARAADRIAASLAEGLDVAFITLGDPMLYSTFTYLVPLVTALAPGVEVTPVAGVTSISAAAAASHRPLAEADERVVIIPAAYDMDEVRRALEGFDTVVLMKVNKLMDSIAGLIDEMGLSDGAVFASRVGWDGRELVTSDIRSVRGEKLDYFSTLIVRRGAKGPKGAGR